jgi:hypothetical protein
MTGHKTFLTAPVTIASSGKTIEAAKKDLAGILKQIADNEFEISKALNRTVATKSEIDALKTQTPVDKAQEIERKREDLAAAIALGEKSSADLVAFEKEVKLAEKSRDKAASLAEQIKPLEVELRGLRRRIDVLNAEGARLQEAKKIAARDLCRANYEAKGAEALQKSIEYRLLVAETVAWGDLHKNPKLGGSNSVGSEVEYNSIMPLGTDSTHNRTPSFSSGEMGPLYHGATDEILAGLAAEGLELFPPAPPVAAPVKKAHAPGIGEGRPIEIARPPEPLRAADGSIAPTQAITE